MISLVVVDREDRVAVTLDRVVPAKVELDLRSRGPAIDRVVRVAAVEESNDLAVPAVVTIAADREDRAMGIGRVDLGTEIVPVVREAAVIGPGDLVMEIALVAQEMAIVPAGPVMVTIVLAVLAVRVREAEVSSGGRVIARDVPVIDRIGPTVRIDRIAAPIGTNGRIGVTIVGRT